MIVRDAIAELSDEAGVYPTSAVFCLPEVLPFECHARVIDRALTSMKSASTATRREFEVAVRDSEITLKGFSDPSKAPPPMLRNEIRELAAESDDLASVVLRSWVESHKTLREKVERHLEEAGIPLSTADAPNERFKSAWDHVSYLETRDSFIEAHPSSDFEDCEVGLMLSYQAGMLPELQFETQADRGFAAFLDFLRLLPPDAAPWDQDIPELVKYVQEIAEAKKADIERFDRLADAIDEFRNCHRSLLEFFERDTGGWSPERLSPDSDLADALHLIAELKSRLREYQDVHSPASTISEERKRSAKREQLRERAVGALDAADRLFSNDEDYWEYPRFELRLEEIASTKNVGEQRDSAPTDAVAAASAPSSADSAAAREASVPRGDPASADSPQADGQIGPTARHHEALQIENRDLREVRDELRRELHDSRLMAESWRIALRKPGANVDEPPPIESLEDAVNLARKRFVGKLKIWPNSKSEVEGNPFDSPRQAWDALEWLATTYRDSRMGKIGVPDLDTSIREACGWWYKSHQNESTVAKYEEWYSATVDGRTYRLHEHIGTGSSRDSRYTIRMGIDWDKRRNRVVVGYIGQHPKTDAT